MNRRDVLRRLGAGLATAVFGGWRVWTDLPSSRADANWLTGTPRTITLPAAPMPPRPIFMFDHNENLIYRKWKRISFPAPTEA